MDKQKIIPSLQITLGTTTIILSLILVSKLIGIIKYFTAIPNFNNNILFILILLLTLSIIIIYLMVKLGLGSIITGIEKLLSLKHQQKIQQILKQEEQTWK
jgi:glycerol-3-phosphate acyltransferase PlsY